MSLHGIGPRQALDYQDYQPIHGLAHEPWPSWDMLVLSFLFLIVFI